MPIGRCDTRIVSQVAGGEGKKRSKFERSRRRKDQKEETKGELR